MGADDAEVTLSASQRAERLPAPFVDASTATDFLSDRGLDWYFHVGPTARTYGAAFLSLLARREAQRLANRRLAMVFADDRVGNDAANATAVLAADGGYTLAPTVRYDPGTTDLRSQVEAVRAANPDAVLAAPTAATAGALLDAFRAVGYRPPALLVFDAQAVPADVVARAGPSTAGLCRPVAWSAELAGRNPLARAVAGLYRQRFREPMTEAAARAFTAVLASAQAIDQAGSTGPDRVRSALLGLHVAPLDVIMPWSGIRFDATRQNTGAGGVVEQYAGGGFRVVYPRDMTVRDLAWPAAAAR